MRRPQFITANQVPVDPLNLIIPAPDAEGNIDLTGDPADNPVLAAAFALKQDTSLALTADNTYNGPTIPDLVNLGGVTQWDAVYLNSSSQWVRADANGVNTYPARGLAVETALTTVVVPVLVFGVVRSDAWDWSAGLTIYLDTSPGVLTQTPPAVSGDQVQAVGWAISADIAFFNFDPTFLEVA